MAFISARESVRGECSQTLRDVLGSSPSPVPGGAWQGLEQGWVGWGASALLRVGQGPPLLHPWWPGRSWEGSEAVAGEGEPVLGSEPESCRDGQWEVALPDEYFPYLRNSTKWSYSRFCLGFFVLFGLVCFSARKPSVWQWAPRKALLVFLQYLL